MDIKHKPRIPPGQRQVTDFPVLHLGGIPRYDAEAWDFRVEGAVEKSIRLNRGEFLQLPRTVSVSDFHCVTGWSRLDNQWQGVSFREVVRLVRPRAEASAVTIHCDDGYYTSLPLSDLMEAEVILAYRWGGQDLEPAHGWPLRLVAPRKYAYKSAKWVRRLRFTPKQEPGYWEVRGYSNTADPWTEDRYS